MFSVSIISMFFFQWHDRYAEAVGFKFGVSAYCGELSMQHFHFLACLGSGCHHLVLVTTIWCLLLTGKNRIAFYLMLILKIILDILIHSQLMLGTVLFIDFRDVMGKWLYIHPLLPLIILLPIFFNGWIHTCCSLYVNIYFCILLHAYINLFRCLPFLLSERLSSLMQFIFKNNKHFGLLFFFFGSLVEPTMDDLVMGGRWQPVIQWKCQ